MARNLSHGSCTKGGAPGSPGPTPEISSVTTKRVTRLEDCFNEVRQTSIPCLRDKIELSGQEIRRVNETLENQRSTEVGGYARVKEVNKLRTMFEQQMRQCTGTRQKELSRTLTSEVNLRGNRSRCIPVIMTPQKSRNQFNLEYDRRIVDQS